MTLEKVRTDENLADALTKAVDRQILESHLETTAQQVTGGRHALAPETVMDIHVLVEDMSENSVWDMRMKVGDGYVIGELSGRISGMSGEAEDTCGTSAGSSSGTLMGYSRGLDEIWQSVGDSCAECNTIRDSYECSRCSKLVTWVIPRPAPYSHPMMPVPHWAAGQHYGDLRDDHWQGAHMGATGSGDTAPEMERPRGLVSDVSPMEGTDTSSLGFSCFSHVTPRRPTDNQWERPAEERSRVKEMTHAIEERARESSAEAARQHAASQRSEMGVDLLGIDTPAPVTPAAVVMKV